MSVSLLDNLKNISTHNRQRIIEVIGLDTELQQLLINKYCNLMSREDLAELFHTSPETIDKKVKLAKTRFLYILENEYELFTKEQKELLNLLKK